MIKLTFLKGKLNKKDSVNVKEVFVKTIDEAKEISKSFINNPIYWSSLNILEADGTFHIGFINWKNNGRVRGSYRGIKSN